MTILSFLELLKYIFLGLIQGLTEVLPISSSGHVEIAKAFLQINADEGILFLTLVNLGSLIAIVYHFRKLIISVISETWNFIFFPSLREQSKEGFYYGMKILVAAIPTAIIGLLFKNSIEQFYTQYIMFVVAIGLLITSTLLYIVRNSPNKHVDQNLSFKDSIIIGLVQPFSIFPGLSRSGITTSTGLLRKVSMDTALSFSFMLYIPVSFGSFLIFFFQWILNPTEFNLGFDITNKYQYVYYGFAFLASLIATRLSLKYIFSWFRQGKLIWFSVYTMFLGIFALIFAVITY